MDNIFNYIHITVVLIIFLGILYIKNKILCKISNRAIATNSIWRHAFVSAISSPSTCLIILLVINYALEVISLMYDNAYLSSANTYIRTIGFIVTFTWFLLNLIRDTEKNYFTAKNNDKDSRLDVASSFLLGKVLKIFIIITAVILVLQNLGYSLAGLLTIGGAGSLILGLAAKDMLANLFGGLTVNLDTPFRIGDSIKTDNNKLEGVVEKIGWRSTRIRNPEQSAVYVPNSIWSNAPVENVTRMVGRRIKEVIGLRYKDADKIKVIIKDIEEKLLNNKAIHKKFPIIIKLNELGSSSINLLLIVHTVATKYDEYISVKQDILLMVIEIVKTHNADFAFPTTTLDLPDNYLLTGMSKEIN